MEKTIEEIQAYLNKANEAYKEAGWTDAKINLLVRNHGNVINGRKSLGKKVSVYVDEKTFIRKYKSQGDLMRDLTLPRSQVRCVLYPRSKYGIPVCKGTNLNFVYTGVETKPNGRKPEQEIAVYSVEKKLYKTYDSIGLCAEELNISQGDVSTYTKKKGSIRGYYFKLIEKEKDPQVAAQGSYK